MGRKRTLLERSEPKVCWWRSRNDDKSAGKMDESGKREQSLVAMPQRGKGENALVANWLKMRGKIAEMITAMRD
jgi:hypothetical protein